MLLENLLFSVSVIFGNPTIYALLKKPLFSTNFHGKKTQSRSESPLVHFVTGNTSFLCISCLLTSLDRRGHYTT